MNTHVTTITADEAGDAYRGQVERERRMELRGRVDEAMERFGWSKAETARRIDMADATFSQWHSNKYPGRLDTQNNKIETWLDSLEETLEIASRVPASPAFVETRTSREIMDTLRAAQVMPALVMVSCAAGLGKTMAARQFHARNPHSWIATISPHTKTVHGMLTAVIEALDMNQPNPARLVSSLGRRLQKVGEGSLLIVDEAQNLTDDGINQLRHFVDLYGCGVALLGNEETYDRFKTSWSDGPKYGQLRRRVFKRYNRIKPYKQDVEAFIAACGVDDPAQVKFLTGVGMKPGALGQIDMTVKLAKMTAIGANRDLTLSDLKRAWTSRDVEAVE